MKEIGDFGLGIGDLYEVYVFLKPLTSSEAIL